MRSTKQIGNDSPEESLRRIVEWIGDFDRLVEEASLVQARARLESVILETAQARSARGTRHRVGQSAGRDEQPGGTGRFVAVDCLQRQRAAVERDGGLQRRHDHDRVTTR